MDIRVGEKISGVIKAVDEEGYTVALCNDITGYAPKDDLIGGIDPSELNRGSEVEVRVSEKSEDGSLKLTIIKLFAEDKYQQKPDKYLENLSQERNNGGGESKKSQVAEEFQEWVTEVKDAFDEVNQHRKERLDKDFWSV